MKSNKRVKNKQQDLYTETYKTQRTQTVIQKFKTSHVNGLEDEYC